MITVQVENLTAQLQENREILFLNREKEVVFTMTPDKAWLNDESRVYPITIDPQVTTSSDPQNIVDKAYKPFLTLMEFDVTLAGTIS